jgi:hypothetical protein
LEFGDGAETAGCGEVAGDPVFAALVVGWRAPAARGSAFHFDAGEEAVEGEIEVEAALFAIGEDIEAGAELVLDGDGAGVVLEFLDVVGAEGVEVRDGVFEPCGEWIGTDDRVAERDGLHGLGGGREIVRVTGGESVGAAAPADGAAGEFTEETFPLDDEEEEDAERVEEDREP